MQWSKIWVSCSPLRCIFSCKWHYTQNPGYYSPLIWDSFLGFCKWERQVDRKTPSWVLQLPDVAHGFELQTSSFKGQNLLPLYYMFFKTTTSATALRHHHQPYSLVILAGIAIQIEGIDMFYPLDLHVVTPLPYLHVTSNNSDGTFLFISRLNMWTRTLERLPSLSCVEPRNK